MYPEVASELFFAVVPPSPDFDEETVRQGGNLQGELCVISRFAWSTFWESPRAQKGRIPDTRKSS